MKIFISIIFILLLLLLLFLFLYGYKDNSINNDNSNEDFTNNNYDKLYFIDKILYINLYDRDDRKTQIENELKNKTLPSKIIRIDAVRDKPGHIGCSKSHIKALELALREGWNNVLVLEDDAMFYKFEKGLTCLKNIINKDPNFDAILLGGVSANFDKKSSKLYSAQTASSYIVNKHYYKTLLDNFKEGLSKLMITKEVEPSKRQQYESKYCIDQYWKIFKEEIIGIL